MLIKNDFCVEAKNYAIMNHLAKQKELNLIYQPLNICPKFSLPTAIAIKIMNENGVAWNNQSKQFHLIPIINA